MAFDSHEAAILNLGSKNQLMGFKRTMSSSNSLQINFYFSGKVHRLNCCARLPKGRAMSWPFVSPTQIALGRTRLHTNPVVLPGTPQIHPAALHIRFLPPPPRSSALLWIYLIHFTPSLNSCHTQPSLYSTHTERVYLFCSFILYNLITNSLRQEARLIGCSSPS